MFGPGMASLIGVVTVYVELFDLVFNILRFLLVLWFLLVLRFLQFLPF